MKGTINIIFAVIAVLICVSAGILYQMDQDMKQNGPILFTVESISEKKEDVLTSTEGWKEAEITAVSEDHTSITAKLLSRNEELKDTYAIEGNEAGIYTDICEIAQGFQGDSQGRFCGSGLFTVTGGKQADVYKRQEDT